MHPFYQSSKWRYPFFFLKRIYILTICYQNCSFYCLSSQMTPEQPSLPIGWRVRRGVKSLCDASRHKSFTGNDCEFSFRHKYKSTFYQYLQISLPHCLHFNNWVYLDRSFLWRLAELHCHVWRMGSRSRLVCFSTCLYIICGLLLLYTINIVWYSDTRSHISLFSWFFLIDWCSCCIIQWFSLLFEL